MRKIRRFKNTFKSVKQSVSKRISRVKLSLGGRLKHQTRYSKRKTTDDSNEESKISFKTRLSVRCQHVYTWCKRHPRIVASTLMITVIIISPEIRLVIIKIPKQIFKIFHRTSGSNDFASTPDTNAVPDKFFSLATLKKVVIFAGVGAFILISSGVVKFSSDLEETGETISFIFEDSLSGESVNFLTKDSTSNNRISFVSITNVLGTSVNYVGSFGASVAAYANSALLARIGFPVLDTNDASDLGALFAPVSLQLDWILSSRPWKFLAHYNPVMAVLNVIGFQIPKFGPYPLSELIMYHPSFNIYSDVSPEYSPWNWETWINFILVPEDEVDEVIGPIMFSLLWDEYTLEDLGSLHPYLSRFLRD